MKKKLIAVLAGLSIAGIALAGSYQSKYATHATSSAVNFPATKGSTVVKALHAESDKAAGLAKVYARTGDPLNVTTALSSGATTVTVADASSLAASDLVVYQHADGTVDYTTVSSTGTTSFVLAAGISQAGTTSDKVYELSQQGQYDVAAATVSYIGDAVFTTPDDSPLRVVVDSTSAGYVTVTVATDQ